MDYILISLIIIIIIFILLFATVILQDKRIKALESNVKGIWEVVNYKEGK